MWDRLSPTQPYKIFTRLHLALPFLFDNHSFADMVHVPGRKDFKYNW